MADALAQSSQREPCQTRQRNALKADITAGPNLHWLEPKYILHRDRPGMHVMKATGPTFNDRQANYCTEPLIKPFNYYHHQLQYSRNVPQNYSPAFTAKPASSCFPSGGYQKRDFKNLNQKFAKTKAHLGIRKTHFAIKKGGENKSQSWRGGEGKRTSLNGIVKSITGISASLVFLGAVIFHVTKGKANVAFCFGQVLLWPTPAPPTRKTARPPGT